MQWDAAFTGKGRKAALSNLGSFLQDRSRPCKFLICTETSYGWDLESLERLILQRLSGTRSTNLLGNSITSIVNRAFSQYGTVKASIKAQAPPVVIRVVNLSLYDRLRKYVRSPEDYFLPISFACAALALFTLIASSKGSVYPPSNAVILIGLLSTGSALSTFGAFTFARERCAVHETLGMAWALKYDMHVLKGGASKAEIIASIPYAIDATETSIGAWDVIVGMDEEEYWRRNEEIILAAIRRNHQGVLCPERNIGLSHSFVRSTSASCSSNHIATTSTYFSDDQHNEPPPEYS